MNIFKPCFQSYLNQSILTQSKSIQYVVADLAPSDEKSLFERAKTQGLIIWSGASDSTVFNDSSVNHAFRALHDNLHLKTGLGFSPAEEIRLGALQSSLSPCPYIAEIIRIEVAEQAAYYLSNGIFVVDQIDFMRQKLSNNKLFKGLLN